MDNGLSSFSSLLDVFNTLPDAIVIVNHAGIIVLANKQAESMFGYTDIEFLERNIETLMPGRFHHQPIEHQSQYNKHPSMRPMDAGHTLIGLKNNGAEFPIEIHISPLQIDAVPLTIAVIRDITDRVTIERSNSILTTVVEFTDDAIVSHDLQGIITSWNKGAEKLYGYTANNVIGQSIIILFPKDNQDELPIILRKIERGESLIQFETVRIRKDGKAIPVAITMSPVYNKESAIIATVSIARNITEQRKVEDDLRYFADHDTLTGLINHVILTDRIVQSIAWAKRYQSRMAVCFIDLDDFKKINDVYGHAMGDKVLATTAKSIQACLREVDTIARVGGDEFGLILLEITDAAHAIKVIKKVMRRFEKNINIDGISIRVTLSVGVAVYPDNGEQLLLEKADAAMYYVKEHGKNNVKLFDKTCPYRQPTDLE